MKNLKTKKGVLTIEASISYSIFLMVIVTLLFIMRIVYAYGLIQHAAAQTAKELSMYTYIYQVSGLSEINQEIQGAAADRTAQFNSDVGSIADLISKFKEKDTEGVMEWQYEGTTDPKGILTNIGAVLVGQGGKAANELLFESVVIPMMASYIDADSEGAGADARLEALGIKGGMSGLHLTSSSFCEDGVTIDLVVCYTIDPVFPIDVMPEMNFMNRAYVRGMNGKTVFSGGGSAADTQEDGNQEETSSIWDNPNATERGRDLQTSQGVRNLPGTFPAYAGYDATTGKATATTSVKLYDSKYSDVSKIKGRIKSKIDDMNEFDHATVKGVTLTKEDITSRELIVYVPSNTDTREIDYSNLDIAVRELQITYPDIIITVKKID